ncbi:hypothetical protein PoB_004929700 [Plakobranchus ocellatus]|uniref:DOMON domain-containing protein n=1 Tax=Plakobranchus ocellatus TaxID=259542 RepID=A0AAV4BTR5_9GAST|nr:hypothetical protein PoB_004929700 [Plakobranchus ocellatus]
MRSLFVGILLLLQWTNVHAYLPLWKNLLTHHLHWEGGYIYKHGGPEYDCSLTVHSIGLDKGSTSFVTLTAEHITVDMDITTDDDVVILLKEEAAWNKTETFHHHTQIQIEAQFVSDHLYYSFMGNVSSAEEDNFATIVMRPRGFNVPTHHRRSHTSLKYGLVLGIPIACAAVMMVAAAMIMWWAVKRGYVRHVPWSYKSFHNSDQQWPVAYQRDSNSVVETPAVHI